MGPVGAAVTMCVMASVGSQRQVATHVLKSGVSPLVRKSDDINFYLLGSFPFTTDVHITPEMVTDENFSHGTEFLKWFSSAIFLCTRV